MPELVSSWSVGHDSWFSRRLYDPKNKVEAFSARRWRPELAPQSFGNMFLALLNIFLTKYTSCYDLSISWTSSEIVSGLVTERYRSSVDPSLRRLWMGGDVKNDFIFEKSSLYSLFHLNLLFLFRETKMRKLDRAARWHVICWTSFMLVGFLMSMTIWHLSRFASMPLFFSMNLMNFPACTPKEHFKGFKCLFYFMADCRMSFKYAILICTSMVFIIMSST